MLLFIKSNSARGLSKRYRNELTMNRQRLIIWSACNTVSTSSNNHDLTIAISAVVNTDILNLTLEVKNLAALIIKKTPGRIMSVWNR